MSWFAGLEHIVREQVPLAPWTWLRIGGPAEYFAEPGSQAELAELLTKSHRAGHPVRFLGAGSNLLVSDQGVAGVVVHLSSAEFAEIQVNGDSISAGGGAKLNQLVSAAAGHGLAGLESLVGIPGTVGGAIRNNTSGHGASIGQWTQSVRAMKANGEAVQLTDNDLRFTYRNSNLDDLVILSATLELERGDPTAVTRQMQKLWILKRAAQPSGEFGHCQVFMDPRGTTASEVIDQAGAKGLSVGGATLCERNPNFIEVRPGTTNDEVKQLIADVRAAVSQTLGVELVPGIQIW